MLILVVQSYQDNAKGKEAYASILKVLKHILNSGPDGFKDFHYLERYYNELGDLVVDWEYDRLDRKAQENSIKFDKIDLIVVVGDLSTLPWAAAASQVITLIHMAKHMNKPYLGIGFGALTAMYTFATKGVRFNILNEPFGGCIEELPQFPNYSLGTGAYPSGWLDRETGDIYTYQKNSRMWSPICNVGIHFVASKGAPGSPRAQAPKKQYISYDDMADPSQQFYRQDGTHEAVRFKNNALNHYLLRNVPTNSHSFLVDLYPEWYINREGALPTNDKLLLIGESNKAPVIFLRDNMLLLGCKLDRGENVRVMEQLLSNFLHRIIAMNIANIEDKIELSMHEFLFGAVEMGHGKYDSVRDRKAWTPALSQVAIRTELKAGPVRVDPPPLEMFFRAPTREFVDFFALTAKRRSSSVGRRPNVEVQNPLSIGARKKRIELAFERIGIRTTNNAVEQGLQANYQDNPDAMRENMPESAKEMLTGKVLKDISVTTRRHHKDFRAKILSFDEISQLDYAKIFPPTPKTAADLEQLPALMEDVRAARTPTNGNRSPKVSFHRPSSPPKLVLESPIPFSKKVEVPVIANWDQVFRVPNQSTALDPQVQQILQPQLSSPGDSRRSSRDSTKLSTSRTISITPWSATSTTASLSQVSTPLPPSSPPPSARKSSYRPMHRTPRTAKEILCEAVQKHYLPIHRPKTVHRPRKFSRKHRNPEDSSSDEGYDSEDEEEEDDDDFHVVESLRVATCAIEEVVIVETPRSTPRSNYLKLSQTLQAKDDEDKREYKGYYTTGHLSPFELQVLRERESKRLNLSGRFVTAFNEHKSAMALRPEGGIRSEGPYPSAPDFGFPPQTKAIEWHAIRSTGPEEKAKWVGGPWKR